MSKTLRNGFLVAVGIILILGALVGTNSQMSEAVNDTLSELPFIGQTWDIASKLISAQQDMDAATRTVWDDIIRSIFVALASIPFQRMFGLIFGFHYTGKETADTPLSFGNRMRDFIYAGLAILVASSLFVLVTESNILEVIMPGVPDFLRFLLLCIILAVVDYVFFRYSMSSLRVPVYVGFVLGLVRTILEVQLLVFLICLFILGLQNYAVLTFVITLLLALGGIAYLIRAGRRS